MSVGLTISTLNAYGYGLLREYSAADYQPIAPDSNRESPRAGLNAASTPDQCTSSRLGVEPQVCGDEI